MARREEIVTLTNGILCLFVLEAERKPTLQLMEDARDFNRVDFIFQYWIAALQDCLRDTNALRKTRARLGTRGQRAISPDKPIVLVDEDLRMQRFRGIDYSLHHTPGAWKATKANASLIKLELVQTFAVRAGAIISMTQHEFGGGVEMPVNDEPIVAWSQWTCYVDSREPTIALSAALQTRLFESLRASLDYRHERLFRAASHHQSFIPEDYSDGKTEGPSAFSQLPCSLADMTYSSDAVQSDDPVAGKPVQSSSCGSPYSIGFISIVRTGSQHASIPDATETRTAGSRTYSCSLSHLLRSIREQARKS